LGKKSQGRRPTQKRIQQPHAPYSRVGHPQSDSSGEDKEKKEGFLTLDGGFGMTA
jgi:hypothetical protein